MKYFLFALLALPFLLTATVYAKGGPQLGLPASGPVLDKSDDETLKALIENVAPQFQQFTLKTEGIELAYNLFVPKHLEPGQKYPMVVFMADASTPGRDVHSPLTQGYGALLFAAPESQSKNPCYVLVPQFSGVAVNDAYQHTKEADALPTLVRSVAEANAVDRDRIYVTGQSMGGMLAMHLDATAPGLFAASLYVDCHWDTKAMDTLVMHPFVFIYAGDKGKAYPMKEAIEEAARKMGKSYTWSEWSARLPQATQDQLAATMLAKNQPINIFGFENGTVIPENKKGSEHMYSFDCAYKLTPVREWLFRQNLAKTK